VLKRRHTHTKIKDGPFSLGRNNKSVYAVGLGELKHYRWENKANHLKDHHALTKEQISVKTLNHLKAVREVHIIFSRLFPRDVAKVVTNWAGETLFDPAWNDVENGSAVLVFE